MHCDCGHEHHHHFSKEDYDKAVKRFIDGLGKDLDLDAEYEKIKNKDISKANPFLIKHLPLRIPVMF